MTLRKILAIAIFAMVTILGISAQDSTCVNSPVTVPCRFAARTAHCPPKARLTGTSTKAIGFGSTHILDTYLSQEKFAGRGITLLNASEYYRPEKNWSTMLQHEANLSYADDRSESITCLQADYSFFAARLRSWHTGPLCLQAGVLVSANIGIVYKTSNSNNPAQAKLALNLMPVAVATCPFRLFRQNFSARYEVFLPFAGLMFSPNYGQSYYEIFSRGNYDHNLVPTTFVSAPNIRQQLSIDYTIPRFATLRLGYLGHYQQANVNNLKSHIYQHRLMLGFVRHF